MISATFNILAQGNFIASFRLSTANETCSLVVDVAADDGDTILARRTVNGTDFDNLNEWQEFEVPFRLEVPTKLEFRGFCQTNDIIAQLDYIRVQQTGPP